jgi:Ni/Co efflux regulator RcnB
MNAKILVTATAVAVLAAVLAAAQTTSASDSTDTTKAASATAAAKHTAHHRQMASNEKRAGRGAYAAPQQPVPYAQLDAYMKATPKERLAMEQQANTGGAANASATVPAQPPPAKQPE